MLSRIHRRFSRPGRVGPVLKSTFGFSTSRRFSSRSNDENNSPAEHSKPVKNVSHHDATQTKRRFKSKTVSQSSGYPEEQNNQGTSDWVQAAIAKKTTAKKSIEPPTEPLRQFSEALKSLKETSKTVPLDSVGESFFMVRLRKSKNMEEKSQKATSNLKPEEHERRLKEAAKQVTAKAGEASAVLEEELMKGVDNLDNQSRRNSSYQPSRFSKQDMSVLENPDVMSNFDAAIRAQKFASRKPNQPNQSDSTMNVPTKLKKRADFDPKSSDPLDNVFAKIDRESLKFPDFPEVDFEGKKSFPKSLDEVFSLPPMGLFPHKVETGSGHTLRLWSSFEQDELRRNTLFEPTNWWAQCIKWTEEGRMWHFPIDNEQGMVEEENVDFSEHIFLDQHIESWCPKQGPIKHFMDLVLIGLSKNPHLTVGEKIENIEWFRLYFEKHKTLLQEIQALDAGDSPIQQSNTSESTSSQQ